MTCVDSLASASAAFAGRSLMALRRQQTAYRAEYQVVAVRHGGKRHQAGLEQRTLLPVGQHDLHRAAHPELIGIGAERLQRQIGHETAADAIGLHTTHIGRPAELRECADHHRGERVPAFIHTLS